LTRRRCKAQWTGIVSGMSSGGRDEAGTGRLVGLPRGRDTSGTASSSVSIASPLVSLVDVEKAYTSEGRIQNVLTGINLEVRVGEIVVILGRSGSGKTTLLNLVGALDRADRGRVESCGVDLTSSTNKQLVLYRAKAIGFVFQFYNLLPTLTAAENVEAGLRVAGIARDTARSRTRLTLSRVGLDGAQDKFPSQLSGGEQQRVAIARAFARRPQLLLADEPTGNLDDETAQRVITLVREMAGEVGSGVIMVTHDVTLSEIATRTVHMANGVLQEQGP
jgi:putative ABC transport system ATP-binding protein